MLRVVSRATVLYVCVLSLTFALLRLAPGDPATFLLPPGASAADAVRMRTELRLDRPIAVQYAWWLRGMLHADLGTSFADARPVSRVIADALPISLARTHRSTDLDTLWQGFAGDTSNYGDRTTQWIDRDFGTRLSASFMGRAASSRSAPRASSRR